LRRVPCVTLGFRLAPAATWRRVASRLRTRLPALLLVRLSAGLPSRLATRVPAALPLQDRLGPRMRIGLEAFDDDARQRPLDQLLDVAQELVLVDADEREGLARGAGAPGAPIR
jgi:hypothetical protein